MWLISFSTFCAFQISFWVHWGRGLLVLLPYPRVTEACVFTNTSFHRPGCPRTPSLGSAKSKRSNMTGGTHVWRDCDSDGTVWGSLPCSCFRHTAFRQLNLWTQKGPPSPFFLMLPSSLFLSLEFLFVANPLHRLCWSVFMITGVLSTRAALLLLSWHFSNRVQKIKHVCRRSRPSH